MNLDSFKQLENILTQAQFMFQMFEDIRVIESKSHDIFILENGELIKTPTKCYARWCRDNKCVNCVSKQACLAEHKMVKLEYFDNQYYFVLANPIMIGSENYVLELITNITNQLATNISNVEPNNFVHDLICKLENVSALDAFTGLLNKIYFEKELNSYLSDFKNNQLSIALIDIDDFKLVNDQYGHIKGDESIITLSKIMQNSCINMNTSIARFGGDEFLILFINETYDDALRTMKRIKETFDNNEFVTSDNISHFNVSLSYGLYEIKENVSFEEIFTRVDKELYKAKAYKNKNQIN